MAEQNVGNVKIPAPDVGLILAAEKADTALSPLKELFRGIGQAVVASAAFEDALTLGRKTAFSARQASQGLEELVKAGRDFQRMQTQQRAAERWNRKRKRRRR